MGELSLGISPCPNDVYVFAGILSGAVESPRFRVHFEDVETLNGLSQRGELDVVKISYANFVHIEADYELLDCGGALGRGCGPLLLTGGGASALDPDAPVLVPGRHTTANFLLDFWAEGHALDKRFLPFDALYDALCRTPTAQGVVIHEKRFTYERDGLRLVQDLGAHWESATGFAIPLGAIAARRSLDAKAELGAAVKRSIAWADAHPQDALALCREHAQEFTDDVMAAHIALYVNDYTRDLGDDGRAAVAFFLDRQCAFGSRA
jgi:1,4-dihydroxy-6-naphthoate synthase